MRAVLLTVITLVALAGCSDENSQIRGQFISGCMQSGASKSICSCMFGSLEKIYSPTEMKALNNQYSAPSKQLVKDLMASAMACQEK